MKKLFSTVMAVLLAASLFCVAPALAEDPEGTVVIQNATTTAEDTENTEFYCNTAIGEAKTAGAVVKSAMEGVDAVALTAPVSGAHATWTPTAGKLTAGGAYEVFAWNIGQKDSGETWRTGTTVAVRDQTAKYTITAAGDKKTVRYIDQRTATGDGNGWVSLGTYIFDGDGTDAVRIDKISGQNWASYTYVDDLKFVPVALSEAKLLHTYTEIATAVAESDPVQYTTSTILTDETVVEGDRIVKRIPATASSYTLTLAAVPGSVVTVDGEEKSVITGTVTPGTVVSHTVTVTAGASSRTYTVGVDMEGTTEISFTSATTAVDAAGRTISFLTQVKDGDTVVEGQSITANNKGYYNVYVQTGEVIASGGTGGLTSTNGKNYVDKMSVDIFHAGLQENVVLDYGRHAYHGSDTAEAWVFAGKYYFNAAANFTEKIVVTSVHSGTGGRMAVPSVKLVSADADTTAAPLAGVVLTAAGKCYSVPVTAFDGNKEYTLSATASDTIGVAAITNNTAYERLQINGVNASPNGYSWISVGNGVTRIPVSVSGVGGTETYTVKFYKFETGKDVSIAGWQANDGTGGTKVSLNLLLNADGNGVQSVTDGYIRFAPALPEAGKYRIIAWQPAFTAEGDTVYGSKNQAIEINTASGPVSITKDWQSLPSKYVDLGVYDLGANAYVKLTKPSDAAYLMVDTMYFIRQTPILVDNEALTEDELDGYTYTTMSDSINLTASISPYMKVGDIALESGVPTNIPLEMGENQVTITVYNTAAYTSIGARYTFTVTCYGRTVGTEAEGVVKTGTWAPSENDGYTAGRKAEYTTGGATIFFPANLRGDYEVSVWRVAESAAFTAAVNGAAAVPVAAGAAEWVSLGEYRFTEANGEGVTITAAADTTVYIDAVRFIPKGDYIFTSAALTATDTGYTVSFTGTKNTGGAETLRVMVAVYSGNQMKNIVIENKTVEGQFEISDISIAASAGDTVKAFLWSGLTPVYQTVTTP